jgi:hypothetical protein
VSRQRVVVRDERIVTRVESRRSDPHRAEMRYLRVIASPEPEKEPLARSIHPRCCKDTPHWETFLFGIVFAVIDQQIAHGGSGSESASESVM